MSRLSFLMPTSVTQYTRVIAWLNLIVNIMIVGTGGLVRLTGSGLGCSQWPLCTEESLVPTSELGVHGLIEFGNRTLTGVLVVVSLLAFLAVVRTPRELGLKWPPFLVGVLIIVQAVVGGVTVWLKLDPRLVGIHFLLSAAVIAVAAVSLQRVRLNEPLPAGVSAPRGVWAAMLVMATLLWITEIVGVLTTGSGPHAGDSLAARNGLDPRVMDHVHSWPGYALLLALVVCVVLLRRASLPLTLTEVATLAVLVVAQVAVGIFQARTGLPIAAVAVHMVFAGCAVALCTLALVSARRGK